MEIQKVTDDAFSIYGRILTGYEVKPVIEAMQNMPCPDNDVIYVPSVKELEELEISEQLRREAYGELPIQVGYCNGNNKKLNALE